MAANIANRHNGIGSDQLIVLKPSTTADVKMQIFNGGGSGSLAQTATHHSLTEITAGSGFLQSHLFDHYELNRCEPALFFALPITRIPQADRVTCQSGGFIASGVPGVDRQPTVCYPVGLKVDDREGFGEVPLKRRRDYPLGNGASLQHRAVALVARAQRRRDQMAGCVR